MIEINSVLKYIEQQIPPAISNILLCFDDSANLHWYQINDLLIFNINVTENNGMHAGLAFYRLSIITLVCMTK